MIKSRKTKIQNDFSINIFRTFHEWYNTNSLFPSPKNEIFSVLSKTTVQNLIVFLSNLNAILKQNCEECVKSFDDQTNFKLKLLFKSSKASRLFEAIWKPPRIKTLWPYQN